MFSLRPIYNYLKPGVQILFVCLALYNNLYAQCTSSIFFTKITAIENSAASSLEKLKETRLLKQQADKCNIPHDTVYARILHRIGAFEGDEGNYNAAIENTLRSLQINVPGSKTCSKRLAIFSYWNLAFFYKTVLQIDKSIECYDKAIQLATTLENYPDIFQIKLDRNELIFKKGDYQKSVEENYINIALAQKKYDNYYTACFFNRLSQAYYFQEKFIPAKRFADSGNFYASKCGDLFEEGTSAKLMALTSTDITSFNNLWRNEIKLREAYLKWAKSLNDSWFIEGALKDLASDYIDFGNIFFRKYKDYVKARGLYVKAAYYANETGDYETLAAANQNIGLGYFYQDNYAKAQEYYSLAFKQLKLNRTEDNSFLVNCTAKQVFNISHKELSLVLLGNKTELLLYMYKQNKDKNYLKASLSTAMLTDSLITQMRNEQFGEQSKLYWRNRTNEFFSNAMEASYLAGDAERALYFLEKSRAVLLNDELNEIGADKLLPAKEIAVQERMQIKIIELQQKISGFNDASPAYLAVQLQLAGMRDSIDNFIKSLNQKYPAYYQYKYADEVPSLKQLQQHLAKNNQSFVHYFIGDTVTYILGIKPGNTKFIRLSNKEFDKAKLADFLKFCANAQALNLRYDDFARLSNSIYKTIFEQLQLPKGRVVICLDNVVIPFEALCTDVNGSNFLINDYSFDYVFSARFLLKQFLNPPAQGSFAGFAPVSFNKSLHVAELTNAADALGNSAAFYKNDKLFTHQKASKQNFFEYVPSYSVVNIFSHAKADTTDNEPVLYMQDSLIRLSELQRLTNPATKLVLLSACQTNVGKAATGEGIYSLARGFASAGIPAVAATLWEADEETIYAVSEKFNQYLSQGMNKDEALQKAKLEFLKSSRGEKLLPYYWANMILIGNADAVQLNSSAGNSYITWMVTAIFVIATSFLVLLRRRRNALK